VKRRIWGSSATLTGKSTLGGHIRRGTADRSGPPPRL